MNLCSVASRAGVLYFCCVVCYASLLCFSAKVHCSIHISALYVPSICLIAILSRSRCIECDCIVYSAKLKLY